MTVEQHKSSVCKLFVRIELSCFLKFSGLYSFYAPETETVLKSYIYDDNNTNNNNTCTLHIT